MLKTKLEKSRNESIATLGNLCGGAPQILEILENKASSIDNVDKLMKDVERINNPASPSTEGLTATLVPPHKQASPYFQGIKREMFEKDGVSYSILFAKELVKAKKIMEWQKMEKEGRGAEVEEEMRTVCFFQ